MELQQLDAASEAQVNTVWQDSVCSRPPLVASCLTAQHQAMASKGGSVCGCLRRLWHVQVTACGRSSPALH